jgi:hypothetical protein
MGKTSWIIWLLYVALMALFMGSFIIATMQFSNPKENTTALTNIGFAVLGGISSICFSWSRAIEEKVMVKDIVSAGEHCFLAALLFLCASAIKFGFFTLVKGNEIYHWAAQVCLYGSVVIFTFGYILASIGILMLIFIILKRRITKEP